MSYPTALEYQQTLQNPTFAFPEEPDLAQAHAELTRVGIPRPYLGTFTATFRLQGESGWAVRCYMREVRDVAERYAAITGFLNARPDPAFTMARLIPQGILVGSVRYDIIQMDWVLGDRLDDYVTKVISNDHSRLAALATSFLDLAARLETLGIAHGDIQHGNVIVDQNEQLRLIDYDDMFLPELRHLRFSNGLGQDNFQHPLRNSTHFDEKLDRFSFMSIYVTLLALSTEPSLWRKHAGGDDNLLFRKEDFLDPSTSALFNDLNKVTPVKEFVDRLAAVCVGKYDDIPSLSDFLDGRFPYSRFIPKVSKARAQAHSLGAESLSASRVLPMAAPPLIGTKIEFEPTDKARIDTAPSAQSQTDVQSTHTRPDRAKSFDVPLITSPLPRMSVASNLPPSSGGIPPSSAGIPPRGNRLRSSRHSDGTALNRDAVLLRVLAGAALAIIGMAVFVVFLGSRKVHVSEAMPLNAALEIRNTKPPIPARAALLSVPRRHPQPQATAMHSSQQSTHYHVANPLMAESRPAISATPRGPNQAAHPGSGQPIPPHENAPVAVKKNVSLVDSADGIGRHDEGSNPGEKQNAMPVNASGNVVPHADPQILPSAASTLCATPDAAAHLLTKASAELSPRTLAAAAGKTVVIAVDVAPDGSVRDAAIVTRSGETRLDLAALSVASRSTYASTEQNCVASPGSVTVTVNF